MTEGASTLSMPAGFPAEEFARLLDAGKLRGVLGPDDLISVLQKVELSPELIDDLVRRVRAEGITWEAEEPEALVAESVVDPPPVAAPKAPAARAARPRGGSDSAVDSLADLDARSAG